MDTSKNYYFGFEVSNNLERLNVKQQAFAKMKIMQLLYEIEFEVQTENTEVTMVNKRRDISTDFERELPSISQQIQVDPVTTSRSHSTCSKNKMSNLEVKRGARDFVMYTL